MNPNRLARAILAVMVLMLPVFDNLPALATTWYVAPNDDDGSDCQTTSAPCLTINGPVRKASDGDTILVSEGIYTATSGNEVVLLDKGVNLSGGWDAGFAMSGGASIIEGGGVRRGVTVSGSVVLFPENIPPSAQPFKRQEQ